MTKHDIDDDMQITLGDAMTMFLNKIRQMDISKEDRAFLIHLMCKVAVEAEEEGKKGRTENEETVELFDL